MVNGPVSIRYAREECSVGAEVTPQSIRQVNTWSWVRLSTLWKLHKVACMYSPGTREVGARYICSSLDSQSSFVGRCQVNEKSLLKKRRWVTPRKRRSQGWPLASVSVSLTYALAHTNVQWKSIQLQAGSIKLSMEYRNVIHRPLLPTSHGHIHINKSVWSWMKRFSITSLMVLPLGAKAGQEFGQGDEFLPGLEHLISHEEVKIKSDTVWISNF